MAGIIKIINKKYQKLKLAYNKNLTSLGLRVFTHNKKIENVEIIKDTHYGDNHLQTYDIIYPTLQQAQTLPVFIYIHGGAWCGGDKYGYTMFCKNFAKQNYIVININYRLIPNVSVETCIDDCILAIKHFKQNWGTILPDLVCVPNFNNVFMVGDSAGAHLVSLIAGLQTSKTIDLGINISALGLYYGVYDFNHIDKDPSPIMLDLDKYWRSIIDNVDPLYHKISTTTYVTKDYPPCFITTGEIDKLHFQSDLFMHMIKYNNIEMVYLSFDRSRQDARHAFLNAPFLMSAKEAYNTLSKFFKEKKLKYEKK